MEKETKVAITPEKLFADLMEVNDETIDEIIYYGRAIEFLKKLESGEVDNLLLASIRHESCFDRKHLKGDIFVLFVKYLLLYTALVEQLEGTVNRNQKGKQFKASDGLIRSVLTNHHQKLMPVRRFCLLAGISTDKYYRIVKKDVDISNKQRIYKIEESLF